MGGGAKKKRRERSRHREKKDKRYIWQRERENERKASEFSRREKGAGYVTQNEERKQCVSNSVIRRKSRHRTVNGHFLHHQERA